MWKWKPVPAFFDSNRDEVQVSWDASNASFLLFRDWNLHDVPTFSYIFEMFGFPSLEVHPSLCSLDAPTGGHSEEKRASA